MFKVFDDLKKDEVSTAELKEAQNRVTGGMVMDVQTIGQQATRRVDVILNGYPVDYYDRYPQRISQVTPAQIRDVMNKYVLEDKMAIVVVAPAERVKGQLEKLGEVEVVPMPLRRAGSARAPAE
jgi:zinc protease